MKKILLLSSVLLSVAACNKNAQEGHSNESIAQQQEVRETLSDYEETKATLDKLFLHAERLKKGEISKEKHEAISYPIGQKFTAQRAALNDEDREKLKEYAAIKYGIIYPEADRKVVTNN